MIAPTLHLYTARVCDILYWAFSDEKNYYCHTENEQKKKSELV